jgi:hypothetical protein
MRKAGKIAITVVVTILAILAAWILAAPGLAVGKYTRVAFLFPYALLTEYLTKTPGWLLVFLGLAPFPLYGFLFTHLGYETKIITSL